ncbi:hypothetical protein SDC9_162587 [bioreactor metagenome]|uniref:Uncharacterized protein n=1 Tax=bioreactor metagenome TaxID=1076179 RepID=A0A645FLG9_9ZZZZ
MSYVEQSTDQLTGEIEEAQQNFIHEDNKKTADSINRFMETWYKSKKFFHSFVNRNKLDDIELLVVKLNSYNELNENSEFISTVREIKEKLEKIREDQKTNFSNIF